MRALARRNIVFNERPGGMLRKIGLKKLNSLE
jgi:hypothetical protein